MFRFRRGAYGLFSRVQSGRMGPFPGRFELFKGMCRSRCTRVLGFGTLYLLFLPFETMRVDRKLHLWTPHRVASDDRGRVLPHCLAGQHALPPWWHIMKSHDISRGTRLRTRTHKSAIPLEDTTENRLEFSSGNPLDKCESFGKYRLKVKLCWKMPLNIHWKMPLNIHWKMPLKIRGDF